MAWVSNPSRNITRPQRMMMPYCTAPTRRELMKVGTSKTSGVATASVRMASIPVIVLISRATGNSGSRRHKWIGEKLVGRKPCRCFEIASRMADHQGIAAGIDLHAGEIAVILQHCVMDQPGGALPIGLRLRQHWRQREPSGPRGPLRRQVDQIQVAPAPAAPVKLH